MNCSGKHAGMLAACVAAGWPIEDYLAPEHPLQQAIAARLADAGEEPVAAVVVDGCGAPQHALPLVGLARGVLSLVEAPEISAAGAVAHAMRAHPWLVAGTGREDTGLMHAVPDLLVKGGAEGVHAAALPGRGAVALKIDDGGDRARTPVLTAGLRLLGVPTDLLAPWSLAPVLGGGEAVGQVRAAPSVGR
jgi:L-asparaginase II